ncbi:MAG: neutral/alkaline non-lysosomal ceramidase N-terminal domain-containing protein [Saprospiraceae bacterium]|nr:neutral/alkaline non-lysosomal ceramidase N-terminal domain-containing protein [Saprospiraceae bacterium]
MYKIGTSKVEMTYFKENTAMLGFGRHSHQMQGIETPQYARTFVFQKGNIKLAYVCAEFCFCTDYLKHGIIQTLQDEYAHLGYTNATVMIVGQHTHSSAGGYDQHLLYNLSMPGFRDDVYECYRKGIVKSIVEADANLQEATIQKHEGSFDPEAEVAYNRSLWAYNKNKEIEVPLVKKTRHLACDRTMRLLRFDDAQGKPIGSLNWFGVHTTSVASRNRKVCSDNKGYAAQYFEDYLKEKHNSKETIPTGFAQEVAGDISPNFIWIPGRRQYRGKYKDDFESAAYNGKIQADKAQEIFEEAQSGRAITGELDYIHAYVDMTNMSIDPIYTNGLQTETTGYAALGVAFLEGTTDGPGTIKAVGQAYKLLYNSGRQFEMMAARLSKNEKRQQALLRYYTAHHPKAVVINMSKGIVAGAKYPERLIIPSFVDPIVKFMKFVNRVGRAARKPWVAERLPLQIFIIGDLAIAAMPTEMTTMAGQRLRNTIAEHLKERGVKEVIISSYANAYCGYVTTYEEYRTQSYEAGHTLFGKWTLAAYQMHYTKLCQELLKAPEDRQTIGTDPVIFDRQEIWSGMDEKLEDLLGTETEEEDFVDSEPSDQ